MKKVLALVTDAYGGSGGLAQANRDLFDALGAVCAVDILPRRVETVPAPQDLPQGVWQAAVASGKVRYALGAMSKALAGRYDAIFCGHLHLAPLAALMARMMRVPVWLHLHGIEAWKRPAGAWRYAAESASLVTCVSRYTRRRFLSWAAVDPLRCRVLPNTCSERYTPGPRSQALIDRYGLEGKKVLLTVGRISSTERYKGHDRLIVLMPRILEKVPNAVYVIAGTGDDVPYLKEVAERCGVSGAVRFVGKVPEQDLPDLYRSCDLFVMPSTGEGFGIVFLEAVSCGLPAIGGRLDGSVDALRDGLAGTLIDPGNMTEMLKAVLIGLQQRGPTDISAFAKPHFVRLVRAIWSEHFVPTEGA